MRVASTETRYRAIRRLTMDEIWISRENVRRFRTLLDEASDENQRQVLGGLLAQEEDKLQTLARDVANSQETTAVSNTPWGWLSRADEPTMTGSVNNDEHLSLSKRQHETDLADLLADPIVLALMAADRVAVDDVIAVVEQTRGAIAARLRARYPEGSQSEEG